MVGASDLRFSLGLPAGSMDGDEPCFLEALAKIQKAADANGLPILGFGTSPEVLQKRLKLGWRAFIVHGDIAGIYSSGVDSLQKYLEVAKNTNIES
jgi:2-keto-3-deoxy-L-rhamnonate aldolase RhmA